MRDECQDLHQLIRSERGGKNDVETIEKYEKAFDDKYKKLLEYRQKVENYDKSIKGVKDTYEVLQQDDATRLMEDANGLTSDDLQRAASARITTNGNQGGLGLRNKWLDNLRNSANPNYYNNNDGNRRKRNGFSLYGGLDDMFDEILGAGAELEKGEKEKSLL